MPEPVPPKVKLGRMIAGRPMVSSAARASSSECAMRLRGQARPMASIASRNNSRSSALAMASREAPINSTPYFSSVPSSARASATLSAVCPPMVGSRASGFSAAMIFATNSGVIGSM